MGTNVDPYQRAEGRYQLMPGIIRALTAAGNPFSILTKGTLIQRDLDLLEQAAQVTTVGLNLSVGFVDAGLSASVEPGTPSPQRRLDACAAITRRGLRCGVLMGPVLPYLSDSPEQLDLTVRQIAASGAASVTPIVLHLRPGAREWYLAWLAENHPDLVDRYRQMYGSGAYAPKHYQQRISGMVTELARKYGVGRASPASTRRVARPRHAANSPLPRPLTPRPRSPPPRAFRREAGTGESGTGESGADRDATHPALTRSRQPEQANRRVPARWPSLAPGLHAGRAAGRERLSGYCSLGSVRRVRGLARCTWGGDSSVALPAAVAGGPG